MKTVRKIGLVASDTTDDKWFESHKEKVDGQLSNLESLPPASKITLETTVCNQLYITRIYAEYTV